LRTSYRHQGAPISLWLWLCLNPFGLRVKGEKGTKKGKIPEGEKCDGLWNEIIFFPTAQWPGAARNSPRGHGPLFSLHRGGGVHNVWVCVCSGVAQKPFKSPTGPNQETLTFTPSPPRSCFSHDTHTQRHLTHLANTQGGGKN